MKRILLLLALFGSLSASAQFPNKDSLQRFINRWVRNNAVDAFTNLRLNTALNGLLTEIRGVSVTNSGVAGLVIIGDSLKLATTAGDTFSVYFPASVSGATNLSVSRTATQVNVQSSTGTTGILPPASQSFAGIMTASDKILVDSAAPRSLLRDSVGMRLRNIYRRGDSVFYVTSGAEQFAFLADASVGSGTVTSVGSGYGLTGGPITGAGTLVVDSAALSSKYLRRADSLTAYTSRYRLDTANAALRTLIAGKLSNITGLVGVGTGLSIVGTGVPGDPYLLSSAVSGGTVTQVNTGYGLSGGPITATGTVLVDTATLSGKYLRRADTALIFTSLTAAINARMKYTDTVSLSDRINAKGSGTVTNFSFTDANGFDGTVSNASTTPTLSLSFQNAAADGATKGQSGFTAADFNSNGSGIISIDWVNTQKASTSLSGGLSATDWNTFNDKLSNITSLITAGTNVSITGAGTSGSPYVINATPGGGGSGTVNSGLANRLAYYAANGTVVDDLASITANRALVSDANGLPVASATSDVEIGYVDGVTSAIQTQINGKQATITTGSTAQYFRGDLSLATFPTNVSTFTNDASYLTNITGKVTAGTNISITGSGTAGSPYVINSSAGGMTNPMTTIGDVIYGGASGTPTRLGIGTLNYVLTSNGSGAAPSWQPAQSIEYGAGYGIDTDGENNFLLDTATISNKYLLRGAIVAGANVTITGSGTGASPYVIASSGGVTDGDKGEVIVSSSGATWLLDNGIAATKIGDGSVSTTEFQYINSLSSNAQTQIDAKLTNPMTTNGDIITRVGGVPTRLAAGSDGQVLTMASGIPSWATPSASDGRVTVSEYKRYYNGEKQTLHGLNGSGAKTSNSAVDISDYLKITPSESITITTRDGSAFIGYGWWYTSSLVAISSFGSTSGTVTSRTATAPSNAAYLIVYVRASSVDASAQMEIKSTSTITYQSPVLPSDFTGTGDADKINKALDFARVTSAPVIVKGKQLLEKAIIVNSGNTLVFDGAHVQLDVTTYDNIIRNEANADPSVKMLRGNNNIKIQGINGAVLQGGNNDFSLQSLHGAEIWRTYGMFMSNVTDFTVSGLVLKATHFAAMGYEFVKVGQVYDIRFDNRLEHLNQAGIIILNGSRDVNFNNLSGENHDDFIEVGNGGYMSDRHLVDSSNYPDQSTDVQRISITNITRTPTGIYPGATTPFNSYQNAVRILAFQGRKVHDITVSNVTGTQNMLIQDHFGGYDETPNGVYNINVNDYQGPVYIGDAIANSSFINVRRYGVGESYESVEAPTGSTQITRKFYDFSQEYMELSGTTSWVTFGGGGGGGYWTAATGGIQYSSGNVFINGSSSSLRSLGVTNTGTGGSVFTMESDLSVGTFGNRGSGQSNYGVLVDGVTYLYSTQGQVFLDENYGIVLAGKGNALSAQFLNESGINYMNMSATEGASGYGIRNSSGVMQFKNSGGSWTNLGGGGGGGGEDLATTLATGNTTGGTAIRFSGSGTDRDVNLYRGNLADGLAITSMKAATGTNAATGLFLYPRGTGFSSGTVNTSLTLWNTDHETDATNYARFQIFTSGSGYIINSNNSGSATLQPIKLQISETDALRINTDRSLTVNSAYTMPLSAGSANQVLAMPSSGTQLVWATAGGGSSQWTLSGTDLYPTTGTEVGIGTTSPSALLHLSGNANSSLGAKITNTNTGSTAYGRIVFENDESTAAGVILMGSTGTSGYAGAGGMTIGTITNRGLAFLTNGNVGMSISNAGVVAIPQLTGGTTDMVTISSTGVIGRATIPGGGGFTSPLTTVGDLLSYNGSAHTRIGAGTSGYVLTSNGTSSQPSWQPATGGTSGVYTPSIVDLGINAASITAYECSYTRVGDVVHVQGMFDLDPVSGGILTAVSMTIPISNNFSGAHQGTGAGNAAINLGASIDPVTIRADPSTDLMVFTLYPGNGNARQVYFTFTYKLNSD